MAAHLTNSDGATGYCSECGALVYLDINGEPVGDTCSHLADVSGRQPERRTAHRTDNRP